MQRVYIRIFFSCEMSLFAVRRIFVIRHKFLWLVTPELRWFSRKILNFTQLIQVKSKISMCEICGRIESINGNSSYREKWQLTYNFFFLQRIIKSIASFIRNYHQFEKVRFEFFMGRKVKVSDVTVIYQQFQNEYTFETFDGFDYIETKLFSFERKHLQWVASIAYTTSNIYMHGMCTAIHLTFSVKC